MSLRPEQDFLPATLRIAALCAERKAEDIRAYDVRGLTVVADSFIVCTAQTEPQAKAISNAVREGMREMGVRPLHVEGTPDGMWLLMDYGAAVLHIFRRESRIFYDLDGLWADAPQIELGLDEDRRFPPR